MSDVSLNANTLNLMGGAAAPVNMDQNLSLSLGQQKGPAAPAQYQQEKVEARLSQAQLQQREDFGKTAKIVAVVTESNDYFKLDYDPAEVRKIQAEFKKKNPTGKFKKEEQCTNVPKVPVLVEGSKKAVGLVLQIPDTATGGIKLVARKKKDIITLMSKFTLGVLGDEGAGLVLDTKINKGKNAADQPFKAVLVVMNGKPFKDIVDFAFPAKIYDLQPMENKFQTSGEATKHERVRDMNNEKPNIVRYLYKLNPCDNAELANIGISKDILEEGFAKTDTAGGKGKKNTVNMADAMQMGSRALAKLLDRGMGVK